MEIERFSKSVGVPPKAVLIDTIWDSGLLQVIELRSAGLSPAYTALFIEKKMTKEIFPIQRSFEIPGNLPAVDPNELAHKWFSDVKDTEYAEIFFRIRWSFELSNNIPYEIFEDSSGFYLVSTFKDTLKLSKRKNSWHLDTINLVSRYFD